MRQVRGLGFSLEYRSTSDQGACSRTLNDLKTSKFGGRNDAQEKKQLEPDARTALAKGDAGYRDVHGFYNRSIGDYRLGVYRTAIQFLCTWQLVINTGTTVITFLMVFLIQRSQNKDALAIHLKLNEIVAALEGASNRLIDVEGLTEQEIRTLHKHFQELVRMAKDDLSLTKSHSIEEASARHQAKHARHRHQ